MMNEKDKFDVQVRLNKIEGQVRGVNKMLTDNRYCMDILAQTRSIVSALRKVEDIIMENHLNTCVMHSMQSTDEKDQQEKIHEIMDLLSKFRKS